MVLQSIVMNIFFFLLSLIHLSNAAWDLLHTEFMTTDQNFAIVENAFNSYSRTNAQNLLDSSIPVLGGPGYFGGVSGVQTIVKMQFIVVPPIRISLELTVYGYGRYWSETLFPSECILIQENITNTLIRQVNFIDIENDTVSDYNPGYAKGQVVKKDFMHNNNLVDIQIRQNQNQAEVGEQSWGITNIVISTSTCMNYCDVCSDFVSCTTCQEYYYYYNSACVEACTGAGWIDDALMHCGDCHFTCLICDGSAKNQCQTCPSPLIHDSVTKTCNCPNSGEYFSPPNCIPCNDTCLTCSDGMSCDTCSDGYYIDPITKLCVSCPESCETCNASGCLTCATTLKYRQYIAGSSPSCTCISAYFERSQSVSYDSSLTRSTYYSSLYGSCIACPENCVECTNEETCTKCSATDPNRSPQNGKCLCTIEYSENPTTKLCEKIPQFGESLVNALSESATSVASGAVVATLPSIVLGSPGLAVQALTIIQILRYILFVNVKYPSIVVAFFELFTFSDGSQFSNAFFDFNDHSMRPSAGFYSHKIDALFLRNSLQNIKSLAILGSVYFIFRQISKVLAKKQEEKLLSLKQHDLDSSQNVQKKQQQETMNAVTSNPAGETRDTSKLTADQWGQVRLSKLLAREQGVDAEESASLEIDKQIMINQIKSQKVNVILEKIRENFEWGLFLGNIEVGFLNLSTFCFLQLQNSSFSSAFQVISFLFSFVCLSCLLAFIVGISLLLIKINSLNSPITLKSPLNNEINSITPLENQGNVNIEFLRQFSLVHTLFQSGPILKQSFYVAIAVRKFLFAAFLVCFYKLPATILLLWIASNFTMIGLLIAYRPYKNILHTIRDILTEILFSAIHMLSLPLAKDSFTSENANSTVFNNIGTGIVACICGIIVVQFGTIILDSIIQIKDTLKKRKNKEPLVPPTPKVSETPTISRVSLLLNPKCSINSGTQSVYVQEQQDEKETIFNNMLNELSVQHKNNLSNESLVSEIKQKLSDIYSTTFGIELVASSPLNKLIQIKTEYSQLEFLSKVELRLVQLKNERNDQFNLASTFENKNADNSLFQLVEQQPQQQQQEQPNSHLEDSEQFHEVSMRYSNDRSNRVTQNFAQLELGSISLRNSELSIPNNLIPSMRNEEIKEGFPLDNIEMNNQYEHSNTITPSTSFREKFINLQNNSDNNQMKHLSKIEENEELNSERCQHDDFNLYSQK